MPPPSLDSHRANIFVSEGKVSVAGDCVLVSGIERRKRLAVLAYRAGANVRALDGAQVRIYAAFRLPTVAPQKGRRAQQPAIDVVALEQELRSRFPEESCMTLTASASLMHGVYLTLHTSRPDFVLAEISQVAQNLGAGLSAGVREIDALAFALRRLMADVRR